MRICIAVNLQPTAASRIDHVARELRRAGMTVDQILSASEVIIGSADESTLIALGEVRGVASVELDADSLPSPDDLL